PPGSCGPGRGPASPGRGHRNAGRCPAQTPASGASRGCELVLGVADPLLELPAVGLALAPLHAFQLLACRVELALSIVGIDLPHVDGGVDESERPVLFDREEARAGRKL